MTRPEGPRRLSRAHRQVDCGSDDTGHSKGARPHILVANTLAESLARVQHCKERIEVYCIVDAD